ncbi:uncharacterized protein [Solanum lycopersicum]|uniref:uncharacterized protein n=1 Tax=Solanum lycopersicum TaxID=4081 RepID=UPI00374A5940
MAIMFFIHCFVLSQLGTAAIPIVDFLMVEDGTYRQYPWGQRAFRSLMNSLRQECKSEKKMYQINGMSYALNVWLYECAFVLDNEIAVKEQNVIPRICNWKVVAEKAKFEMFMESVFTEECTTLQLLQPSNVTHDEPGTSNFNIDVGKPQEVPGLEDFSSEPPDQLLRRSTRVSTTASTPPPKRRKVVHPHKTKVSKPTTSEKQPTQNVYTPDLPTSQDDNVSNVPVNSDFRKVDQQVGCLVELIKKNHFELMKVVGEKDNKTEKDFGSNDKGKAKIDDDVLPLYPFEGCGILEQLPLGMMDEFSQWIEKDLLKSHANKKQSEDKYRAKYASFGVDYIDFVVAFPMDKNWFYTMSQPNRCWTDEHIDVIFYYLRKKSKQRSMDQYYNSHADDTISTQEHMIRAAAVLVHERSIINIINGYSIPAALLWNLVDEVYIPVNCGENFHWVLAVVVLKERLIRERTDWAALDAYKDMKTGELLGPQHSFNVEFAQDNMQQISDSLDCGLFVAVYEEFLSDKINMSCNSFESSYLRKRYARLLLKYGLDKMNAGYVSNSDDPPRMKNALNPSSDEEIVHVG